MKVERGCSVSGCTRPHKARGYCGLHYRSVWWPAQHQEPKPCATCGKAFVPDPGRGRRPGLYCSPRCRGAAISGAAHPHWRGAQIDEATRIRHSPAYVRWRQAVYARDDYTCQCCGQRGGDLHADHVLPFATHPELRFHLGNGRTLCVPCHRATPTYGRRPVAS